MVEDVFLFQEDFCSRHDELRAFAKCFRLQRWGRPVFSAFLMWRQILMWPIQQIKMPTCSFSSCSCKWKELHDFSRNHPFLEPGAQCSCATA